MRLRSPKIGVLVFIDGFACDYHLMMPRKSQQAYLEWKLADEQAQRKEKELDACWDEYFARRGPPPPEELFQEVHALRADVNALLAIALRLVDQDKAVKRGGS